MKLNYGNFIVFMLLFFVEVLIAAYVKQEFIRSIFGDFIVVIMLYYFFKSIIDTKPIYIAALVLIIAYTIEFLQLINLQSLLKFQKNVLLNLILGTTFSTYDLIAYTLGIVTVFFIDKKIIHKRNS